MVNYIEYILKKPFNSLSYKELLLQTSIVTLLNCILAIFVSLFMGRMLLINPVGLFNGLFICCFLYFFWAVFKPILEKKIRYTSDFGEDKIHYEARSSLLLLFGVMAGIFVTSMFYLKGFLFIQCVGIFFSFVLPVLIIFLKRDSFYNENGKIVAENDYEFAYDIQILYVGDIFIGLATLGSGFMLLASSLYRSYPPLGISVILVCLYVILFYAILRPDFWNRHLPFDIKRGYGFIGYLVICGLMVYIMNIVVIAYIG